MPQRFSVALNSADVNRSITRAIASACTCHAIRSNASHPRYSQRRPPAPNVHSTNGQTTRITRVPRRESKKCKPKTCGLPVQSCTRPVFQGERRKRKEKSKRVDVKCFVKSCHSIIVKCRNSVAGRNGAQHRPIRAFRSRNHRRRPCRHCQFWLVLE